MFTPSCGRQAPDAKISSCPEYSHSLIRAYYYPSGFESDSCLSISAGLCQSTTLFMKTSGVASDASPPPEADRDPSISV